MTEPSPLTDPAPLRDYLERVGTLFKVPGSELAPKEPPPPPIKNAEEGRPRVWLIVTAILVVVAGLVAALGGGSDSGRIPAPLYGAWGTTDKRYVDRQFWIAEKEIAFQTGPTTRNLAIHVVKAVRQRPGGKDTTFFDLDYVVGEGMATLSMTFINGPQRAILFVNQAGMKWVPAIGGTWPIGLTRPARALDFGR